MDKTTSKNWILKEKKGEVTDIITVSFWILVIGIGILVLMFGFLQLTQPLRDSVLGEDNSTLEAINSYDNYISLGLPSAFLIVFFGLLMGILVSSFFIRTHPIFIPVYILFGIITIIVAVALGNVWGNLKDFESFTDVLELNSTVSLMDTIISNIVLVTVIVFILSLIIIFAKPGGGQIPEQQGGGNPF